MTTRSEEKIQAKWAEANKVELAEKATNLHRWAEAIESEEFQHTGGTFNSGDRNTPRDESGRFTKGGGGGIVKHRCVWGALADLRVQDGVGSWSYGGYSDGESIGQNMPSQELAAFVGLNEGDVVADITQQYINQHMGAYVRTGESSGHGIPQAFVSYNDKNPGYGVLSRVMREAAEDIERRLKKDEAVTV